MSKLGTGKKIAYGLGDTASNLVFQLSLLYLLFFYTDVFGISPAQAGLIFVIARVLDAVSNPVMGYIMDHTKSKSGNARVYLRFGPFPLAVATVLMFLTPAFGPTGKFLWALVTYALWSMLYTMVNIPYASMTAQLSDNPQERTSITSVRMICMLVAVIVVSVVTEPLSSAFADKRTGYLAVALLYGGLAFALFEMCYRSTRKIQLVEAPSSGGYDLRDLVRVIGKNAPALIVALTFFLGSSAEYIRESSVVFYVTYNMGNPALVPVFLGIVVLAMIAGNLLIPVCTERLDKKGTFILGVAIACASSLAFQFIPYDRTVLILACAAVSSIGFSVVSTMGWAMLPDTIEYGELKTGVRSEGIIYAFFSFSQKLATAVGGGIVALALAVSGYAPNAKSQTPTALFGIASTLGFLPLAFLILSIVAVSFYSLDKKTFERIKRELGR
jgi:sugar (glycoside-pentoside-hexuronide) transporter